MTTVHKHTKKGIMIIYSSSSIVVCESFGFAGVTNSFIYLTLMFAGVIRHFKLKVVVDNIEVSQCIHIECPHAVLRGTKER